MRCHNLNQSLLYPQTYDYLIYLTLKQGKFFLKLLGYTVEHSNLVDNACPQLQQKYVHLECQRRDILSEKYKSLKSSNSIDRIQNLLFFQLSLPINLLNTDSESPL